MANNERQGTSLKKEDEATAEQSPTEKLEDKKPGSTVPGAQNPDSKEVKKEINPNTE